MTNITFLGCAKMANVLAGGSNPIMATGAATCHRCVVKNRGRPGQRRMTGVAFGIGDDVSEILAGSCGSIMATGAGADHSAVIHQHSFPGQRSVAGFATVIGLNMGQ